MESTIIANASLEDLNKHLASFGTYVAGGEHREAFVTKQTLAFTTADVNGNGHIERTEFPTLISGIFETFNIEPTDENLNAWFSKIDADQDGKISKGEYLAFLDHALADLSVQITAELEKRGAQ